MQEIASQFDLLSPVLPSLLHHFQSLQGVPRLRARSYPFTLRIPLLMLEGKFGEP